MNYIADLHQLFLLQLCQQDHSDTRCIMSAYMRRHNIRFRKPFTIPGYRYWYEYYEASPAGSEEKFFDKVNSKQYDDIRNFSRLCIDFLDFTEAGTMAQRSTQYMINVKNYLH